jgi:hypothetical protein
MMRLAVFFVLTCTGLLSVAQSSNSSNKFKITLERTGCLGSCPWYQVTILGNGNVKYKGTAYVRIEGVRQTTIPSTTVDKLIQELKNKDFFHWKNKTYVCVDFPEVQITATLDGQSHKIIEGCDTPGRVLALAKEIDAVSGVDRWVKQKH